MKTLDTFTEAYIECMLWSETDNSNEQGGNPLDDNYSQSDFAPETLERIIKDCKDFQDQNPEIYYEESYIGSDQWDSTEMAGHDFWLTRVGHGAGFWDGDWEEKIGEKLTKSCESFGHVDVYVGDDGQLYI